MPAVGFLDALNASGFSAVHVPEEFGGQGADSVATCIVIEEMARVCASSSLIPAVNKLGKMGLILSGSDDLKKQVLPAVGSSEAMASYALSERESGSDAAAMRTRARQDGDSWILNGTKAWITNGGKSTWYTVMASSGPDKGANGISAFMVHKDDEGFTVGPKERRPRSSVPAAAPMPEFRDEHCSIDDLTAAERVRRSALVEPVSGNDVQLMPGIAKIPLITSACNGEHCSEVMQNDSFTPRL